MEKLILLLIAIFMSIGSFFIIAALVKLPTRKSSVAIINIAKEKNKQTKSLDLVISEIAIKITKYIKLSNAKRQYLKSTLTSAEINLSPEMYLSMAYVKTAMITILIPISLIILPLSSPVFVVLAIITYFNETQKADKIVEVRREQISDELPRFVATITQSLKASRDVRNILITYNKGAGSALKNEIDITIADIETGGLLMALRRMEARISLPQMSQIAQGLRGVIEGNNSIGYFEELSISMKAIELARLEKIALSRPPKIRRCSFLLLGCMLMMILGVIGYQIFITVGTMF